MTAGPPHEHGDVPARLPAGATGFGVRSTEPDGGLRSFRTVCHHAARRTGGGVTSCAAAGVTPSFHTAVVVRGDRAVAVLRHTVLPLVALARPRCAGDADVAFVDDATLAAALAEVSGLRVLSVAQLHTPLSRVDLTALTAEEHAQLAYWKPETLGGLLFNFWD
ncbi:hypothetical protein [Micromonospora purpureochromogenes]|uniref:Uncharacterized protein n=1 Tax=Micromonospora purpureochromogenes TaxID=47872 RepID=A0ABX2RQ00_9ACTN|nr:hypothetical protein [Micromonospora purpureochromogenes]NYF58605.1 hypothetical protein [Micromonospora purpureochromogenes]